MRRYLVVANQTLAGHHLLDHVRACQGVSPCWFHIVVPATPIEHQKVGTTGDATLLARRRLAAAIARFVAEGVAVTGEVGDANPLRAVASALRDRHFDEVILSTLPVGSSRWLLEDLPTRLARSTGLRVTHVIVEGQHVADTSLLNA
jgi:GABA permease